MTGAGVVTREVRESKRDCGDTGIPTFPHAHPFNRGHVRQTDGWTVGQLARQHRAIFLRIDPNRITGRM